MSGTPRRRTAQEGFTLVELLVVVLVIGILASIAIPAFLGQKTKAQDQQAKSIVRSGVIAAESYYTENPNQNFAGMLPAMLADHEQNVSWTAAAAEATRNEVQVVLLGTAVGFEDGYVLASRSKTGTTFMYIRLATGQGFRCSGTALPAAAPALPPTGCAGAFSGGW